MSLKDFIEILQKVLEENGGKDGTLWIDGCFYGCPVEELEISVGRNLETGELNYWIE